MGRPLPEKFSFAEEVPSLNDAISKASSFILSQQTPDGYWWYTLEANESISAELIFLMHILGINDSAKVQGIARRILSQQRSDGSWSLTYGGHGDLSTTVECYLACRMAGYGPDNNQLCLAKKFIRLYGGLSCCRVFTKIHLAMLGLGKWQDAPEMPVELMLFPAKAPFSVYSFSSWARACIIPLLIIMQRRPVWKVEIQLAQELRSAECGVRNGKDNLQSAIANPQSLLDVWAAFFKWADKSLKLARPIISRSPTKEIAIRKAEKWIREHIERTEDIFPALSYGAIALKSLGYGFDDSTVAKAVRALESFQQTYEEDLVVTCPVSRVPCRFVYQQCCISPVWDTPWAMVALRESGVPANDPSLLRAARWLLSKQITDHYGDWRFKNPDGLPGGWSFEFQNDYFPDVDDTIQVLMAIHDLQLPPVEKETAISRGLQWCLSMQNDDGGWAAFDRNNNLGIVNKIPFADHGACLDPATPDITGRMLELLAKLGGPRDSRTVKKAISFLRARQEKNGSWFGRWGVNYTYGTWCVLKGLSVIGVPGSDDMIRRGADWLESVQHEDGSFSESVESYSAGRYVPGGGGGCQGEEVTPPDFSERLASPARANGVPSQTGWGLMGLIAAGRVAPAQRAVAWLLAVQRDDGTWEEREFTGTGFPGHFYIRYHGYRYYFPLLALAEYRKIMSPHPCPLPQGERGS